MVTECCPGGRPTVKSKPWSPEIPKAWLTSARDPPVGYQPTPAPSTYKATGTAVAGSSGSYAHPRILAFSPAADTSSRDPTGAVPARQGAVWETVRLSVRLALEHWLSANCCHGGGQDTTRQTIGPVCGAETSGRHWP